LRRVRPEELDRVDRAERRQDLAKLLDGLHDALRGIADAIAAQVDER